MLDSIRHRGPDGSRALYLSDAGVEVNAEQPWRFALGHLRLALVGSAGSGAQPTFNAAGTIVAAVNGEIYNHGELRRRLRTNQRPDDCDCDIVPYVYENQGVEGIAQMCGVFAGAVVDLRDGSLTLFRDTLGARPMYWTEHDGALYFASEIKALLAVHGIAPAMDYQALADYFTYQSPLEDRTLFEGIRNVAPGGVVRYWRGCLTETTLSLDEWTDVPKTFSEAREQIDVLVRGAVARQSHPEGAAYLSSGIDTNCIVSTMAQAGAKPMTFTASFSASEYDSSDQGCDESALAAEAANAYGVPHRTVPLYAAEFQSAFPEMIKSLDDLRMPMAFGSWKIAQAASANYRVLYSGMGSDEIFGGYSSRIATLASSDESLDGWLDSYRHLWERRLLTSEERRTAFVGKLKEAVRVHDSLDVFRRIVNASPHDQGGGAVRRLLTVEQSFFLPGLLIVDDRMSMAHGIETRVPLIDQSILRFSLALPDEFLHQNGVGKRILREAVAERLPFDISARPKQPFRVPEASWYRGQLQGWVRQSLLGQASRNSEYLSRSFVRRVLDDHITGRRNRRHLIWALLSFEHWCRLYQP